jgi:hypothetical protein
VSDDKDVFGKLDALMRRNVAPPASGSDTGAIPVLTELVDVPPEAEPPHASPADEAAARVVAEVQARLAVELERRMAEHLAPQVKEAVRAALAEMRGDIVRMVNEAVAQANERRHVK